MPNPIRVVLADDHPALRLGLRILLDREPDIAVVGEADDGPTALEMSQTCTPDVLVLDCRLPGMDGAAVASELADQGIATRVLALSAYDDDRYIAGMVRAGATGYLLKNEAPSRIVSAVRSVVAGTPLWTPDQLARAERWEAEIVRVRDSLTDREHQVLGLVTEGLSNKEIARQLVVTVRTVDFHVSNILRKLDAVSRVEAAVWAQTYLNV
jgi:DNA-binding NarL/FixJ family response regulator